ncbi:unnamed protein product [Symbiodinium sp. CCMP2592]|nr:unnamed protein product [Symbiodinium sp. CCMP2592]
MWRSVVRLAYLGVACAAVLSENTCDGRVSASDPKESGTDCSSLLQSAPRRVVLDPKKEQIGGESEGKTNWPRYWPFKRWWPHNRKHGYYVPPAEEELVAILLQILLGVDDADQVLGLLENATGLSAIEEWLQEQLGPDATNIDVTFGNGASLLQEQQRRKTGGGEEAKVRLNTMRSLGTFIGPFGSTLLCVLPKEGLFNELNSAGWAIAAANLLGVVLCCYRLTDPAVPSEPRVSAVERGQHGQPPVTAARSFPTTPVIWTCLLFQVTTALLLAVLEVVPPIVLTDEFRLPPAATSILFGIASLAVIALFALVEVLSRKVSGRSLMTAGVLLVSCGALWAQTSWKLGSSFLDFVLPWLVLAVAPAPLLRTPARTLYTSHLPKHVQGTMQGISEAAFSFANFVGPILGSHVATSGGFEGLRLTMLGLVVAEVLLLCVGFSRLIPGTEL